MIRYWKKRERKKVTKSIIGTAIVLFVYQGALIYNSCSVSNTSGKSIKKSSKNETEIERKFFLFLIKKADSQYIVQ